MPTPRMNVDMTPYCGADLPDVERERMDRLFPGSWSAEGRRDWPGVIHAFRKVKEHYAEIITADYHPKIIRDWSYPADRSRDWALVWEEGPEDWAITISHADLFDRSRVFAEPYNGWSLCLYRP